MEGFLDDGLSLEQLSQRSVIHALDDKSASRLITWIQVITCRIHP